MAELATLTFTPTGGEAFTIEPLPSSRGAAGVWLPRNESEQLFPVPEKEEEFAESADSEGGRRIRSKAKNANGTGTVIVSGSDQPEFQGYYTEWEMLVEDMDRFGGTMTYTPAEGDPITYVIEAMKIEDAPYDGTLMRGYVQRYAFSFVCEPYGHLEEEAATLAVRDEFTYDSVTNGDWGFDNGSGTVSVSGGVLVPSSTTVKRMYRTGLSSTDGRTVVKFTTGASVASGSVGVMFKRLDASNMLYGILVFNGAASVLQFNKFEGGVESFVAEVAPVFSPKTNTSYWAEATTEGNKLVVKLYEADPKQGATAVRTINYTMEGALATKFGSGIVGGTGLKFSPPATDWRMDEWYHSSTGLRSSNPIQGFEFVDVPGSVDALVDLSVFDLSSKDRRHMELGLEKGGHSYDTTVAPPVLIDSALFDTTTFVGTSGTVSGAYNGEKAVSSKIGGRTIAVTGVTTQHSGPYRVKARLRHTATEDRVFARIGWRLGGIGYVSEGDFVEVGGGKQWYEVDLGVIEPGVNPAGSQNLQLQIQAYSDGDEEPELNVDYIMMIGAGRWAKSSVSAQVTAPANVSILDEFNQSAGAIVGKSATPIGGTYVAHANSDTNDFEVDATNHVLTRKAVNDSGTGFGLSNFFKCRAVGNDETLTNVAMSVDVDLASDVTIESRMGFLMRVVSGTKLLTVHMHKNVEELDWWFVTANAYNAGVEFTYSPTANYFTDLSTTPFRLLATLIGEELNVYVDRGITGSYVRALSIAHPVLGASGALSEGKNYLMDQNTEVLGTETVRKYDNFLVWEPDHDAVMFSEREAHFRSYDAIRDDANNVAWTALPNYEGARLRIPPAGTRGLASRASIKARRTNVDESSDSTITDSVLVAATLTPRVTLLG